MPKITIDGEGGLWLRTKSRRRFLPYWCAALAVAFGLGQAQAADLGRGSIKDSSSEVQYAPGTSINWNGVYVGGQVGYGNSNHNLNLSDTAHIPASCSNGGVVNSTGDGCVGGDGAVFSPAEDITFASAFLDGVNSSGAFGGGTIGADLQRGNFVFGVFGDYNFSNAKAEANLTEGGICPECFSADASIEDGDSWIVAARAGYLLGAEKRALIYVLGGYGQQDISYHAGTNQKGDTSFNKDLTFSGFVAGAGGEYALSQTVFLGLEYQHFFGGKETIFAETDEGGRETVALTDDMSSDKVMLKLKLKLNSGLDF